MEPIRILCVFSSLDRGGAESMCMNLYRNIDRSKVQFDFVKHNSAKGAFEDEITSLGGRIFAAPRYKLYNHISYQQWWRHFLKEHTEYHIIHVHWFTIASVICPVARSNNRIVIGHSHIAGVTAEKGVKQTIINYIKHVLQSKLEKRVDYRFACGQDAGKFLYPNSTFTVVNNAIDSDSYRYDESIRNLVRQEMNLTDKVVFGTVGRITEQKNPLGIIEIFKEILAHIPNAHLLWVGNGDMRETVERQVADCGLQDKVILTGVRIDVNRLMQAMDVFILPSFYEGLPVVAIEAQAAGLPCLLSNAVTTEAAVTDLCTFLPIDRPELWADAAEKALAAPRRNTQQEIIRAGYDIKTTAAWLIEFYLNCKR